MGSTRQQHVVVGSWHRMKDFNAKLVDMKIRRFSFYSVVLRRLLVKSGNCYCVSAGA